MLALAESAAIRLVLSLVAAWLQKRAEKYSPEVAQKLEDFRQQIAIVKPLIKNPTPRDLRDPNKTNRFNG